MEMPAFSWRTESDERCQHRWTVLECSGGRSGEERLEAWIAPGRGSNLSRLAVDGRNVIDFTPELLAEELTGVPVLYPTPNRVRGCAFRYRGREYPQVKRGRPVYLHGLVHDEPWQSAGPRISPDAISLLTWIDFEPGSACFEAFPFRHRLSMQFELMPAGIRVSYTIESRDPQPIPFGFGLHPYFMKLAGAEGARVALPARSVMEATPDLLPTGRLIPVEGTAFDLSQGAGVNQLDLDHVFTGIPEGKYARVSYPGLAIQMAASPDFSHLVLYTPPGQPYFCLENQTCSTDAHNLHDRGFAQESGLKFVPPGEQHGGSVFYEVLRES